MINIPSFMLVSFQNKYITVLKQRTFPEDSWKQQKKQHRVPAHEQLNSACLKSVTKSAFIMHLRMNRNNIYDYLVLTVCSYLDTHAESKREMQTGILITKTAAYANFQL